MKLGSILVRDLHSFYVREIAAASMVGQLMLAVSLAILLGHVVDVSVVSFDDEHFFIE